MFSDNLYDLYDKLEDNIEITNNIEEIKKEDKLIKCVNCSNLNSLIFDSEFNRYICLNCGFIHSNTVNILNNQQIRENDFKEQKQINIISSINDVLKKNNNFMLKNIFKWNQVSIKEVENNKIKRYIISKCEKLQLKRFVIDDIIIFFNLINENNICKGRNKKVRGNNKIGLIGSCIYYGTKKNNMLISIRTIAKLLNTKTKTINKMCNVFIETIERLNKDYEIYDVNNNIIQPVNYLNNYIIFLNIKFNDQEFILSILKRIENNVIFNNILPHHSALLAILTYLKKEKYGFNQFQICNIIGVSRILVIQLLKLRNQYFDYLYYGKTGEEKEDNNKKEESENKDIENKIKETENIEYENMQNNLNLNYILSCLNV